jgi:hypothetical protein
LQVLERALSLCIGIHRPEWIVQWVSVIAIVLIVSGLRVIFKRSRFDGIYLGLMALLNIGIALNPLMSSRLAERYFSPLILIWLICASTLMAKMRMGNALAGMIVLFQLSLTYQLIETGRGNYLGAIEYIASQTRNPPITISFINDFRGRSLLSFYGGTQQFTYHEALSGGPEWFVLDRDWMMIDGSDILRFPGIQGRVQPPDRELTLTASQRTYQLVNEFTHFGISGSTWTIYRRKD